MRSGVIRPLEEELHPPKIFWSVTFQGESNRMSCLGLTNDGYLTKPASIDLENSGDFNTIESQLWQKIIDKQNGFWSRIIDRYAQLRYEGWFTTEKLLEYHNDNFIATIGQRFYNQDARLKYTKEENQTYMYMCNGSRLEYTKRWIEERLLYLDSSFDYITAYQKVASIRTNANDYLTLRMKAKSPRYIKIKWSDMLTYQKYFVSNDKYYEFTSPILISNTDNNLDFQGIETITEIESFAHLKPSALHLSGMESLTNVDSHDSEFLKEVTLENNKMLQTINLSGCESLGLNQSGESTGNLNLINCSNLKYLDVSGTSLASLNIIDIDTENPDASTAIGTGSLEYFDASGTGITDITIWNQSYLEEILMEDCHELATVSIGNCEKLRSMSLPNSQINKFTIVDCERLTSIDISNTAKLVDLRLDGCPNLLSLNMRQVNSPSLTNLDLTTVPILKELNIANTSFLEYITFADDFSSLKVFDMRNSVLKSIRFGKRGDFPTYLDLSPFEMTSVSFYNCPSLQEIRGIDYNGSGERMFYNCYNLHTVQGNLTLHGNINQICYNCQVLTNLPTLNMKEVTGASESFMDCKNFTMTHVRTIMSSLGDKITTSWRMFMRCTKVIGEIPSNLFSTTPNFGNLREFFNACTGLTGTIPTSLFVPIGDRLTSVSYFVYGCTGMTGDLNNSMFLSNPNLQDTSYMFRNSKIGGVITNQLFSANPNLIDTSYMFTSVTTIQSRIPNGLFANNTKLQNCEHMFSACTGLYGTLPQLFESSDDSNYALTNADYFLKGCTGIYGNIPNGLFKKCPELLRCSAFFRKTGISGDIPNDIFSSCTKLTSAASFFAECTGITSQIPDGLFHNLVALSDVSYFFDGCTNLFTEVPREMFYGCPNVQYIAGMFRNCQKLYGDIPTDLFDYSNKISSIASLFENCYNLTSEIPSNFFVKCGNVQDMSAVFRNDYNIQGIIPKGLFYGCVKAVDMHGMFESCKSLRKDLSNEMIYCVPEDLFIDCPNLENVNRMFNMRTDIGGKTKMTGEIPPRLFEPCSKLLYANYLFSNVPLTGELSDTVFYRSINLKEMNYAFASTGLTSIDDNVFINNKSLIKVEGLFSGCSSMQGNAYQFWNGEHPLITDYGQCYRNCTSLTDYETIPSTWK